MATTITQQPLYSILPVGQDIIFVVTNNEIVANQVRVKFTARVYISSTNVPVFSSTADRIGTFKTTPNNKGIGMFNLSSVVESYVKAENLAATGSTYKEQPHTANDPLHLIDKFSGNNNTIRYLAVRFKVEYLDTATNSIVTDPSSANSNSFKIFNGYLKHSDQLTAESTGFGYDVSRFEISNAVTGQFLTNASLTQYANEDDYGTMAFLTKTATLYPNGYLDKIIIRCYNSSDVQIGHDIDIERTAANGAYTTYSGDNKYNLIYFGCYPANLRNWSTVFQTQLATDNLAYYTILGIVAGGSSTTQTYRINVNCPTLKGYVPIRLAWLNQWGAWDYYTFTQKSVRSLSTKGSTYTQQSGTWGDSMYRVQGYKGGEKSFRVNATERIKMNTDFVNESESEWFEELINSPEVYMLEGYQTDLTNAALNNYVTPVRLTTSSYIRKTIANDKLMQYTFEVEKGKTLRTQAV
jgi:hypothetical protein